MFKLKSRLLVVILVMGLLTVVLSCSQKDDITAPKSLTKVWLDPERLPTPTPGMVYELWASKVAFPAITETSQVRSLGRFSYIMSDTYVGFLNDTGAVRADTNEFSMEGDLYDYSFLFVSVQHEEVSPLDDGLPGPMVVGQSVTGATDTVRMFFPKQDSLSLATMRCNFETPTDDNAYNDGRGLWFCSHTVETIVITDTFDAVVTYRDSVIQPNVDTTYDTVRVSPLEIDTLIDTLNLADLRKPWADSVWFDFDTVRLDFGRDTLALGIDGYIHYGAKQHVLYKTGTDVPRHIRIPDQDLTTNVQWVSVDVFSQDLFGLPDVSDYGWKYKGWIVSSSVPTTAIGAFSPPAWDFTTGDVLFPGYQAGLLTTGTFADERDVDDSDPFTLEVNWLVDSTFYDTVSLDPLEIDTVIETFTNLKRPRFPGEDFLDIPAMRAATNDVITSWPFLGHWPGSVFLSMEPDNMITDTTNFPLIPFGRAIPFWDVQDDNVWTLLNMAGVASGAPGLPKIEARIQRF